MEVENLIKNRINIMPFDRFTQGIMVQVNDGAHFDDVVKLAASMYEGLFHEDATTVVMHPHSRFAGEDTYTDDLDFEMLMDMPKDRVYVGTEILEGGDIFDEEVG